MGNMMDGVAFMLRAFFVVLPIAVIATLAWAVFGILWLSHHVSFAWR